jgi:Tfp pilus assembly protein PilX
MKRANQGFTVVTVLTMLVVLAAVLTAYATITQINLKTTRSSANQAVGFYAAEGGLNLRAEVIRNTFVGFNRPTGPGPTTATPCTGGDIGSNDFACKSYTFKGRQVPTYVIEDTSAANSGFQIPAGELYAGLTAQQYTYNVYSRANGTNGKPEAVLTMKFQSRLVPLFQFMAFYQKDLEIEPGADMNLNGPIHTNGSLYLNAGTTSTIQGQITTSGTFNRGRKDQNTCGGTVNVYDPGNAKTISCSGGATSQIPQGTLDAWNGQIKTGVTQVTVPPTDSFNPTAGNSFWDKADLRIMANYNLFPAVAEVRNADNSVNPVLTAILATSGAVTFSNSFYNNRESKKINMMDINQVKLMNAIQKSTITGTSLLGPGKDLSDKSEGGLIFYLGADGPNAGNACSPTNAAACTINNYGTRITNAATLGADKSTYPSAPAILGLSVISNQAMYTQGDYNLNNKKPASIIADSLNVLSNSWNDSKGGVGLAPVASSTTLNAAFLAGTDGTVGSSYNGGLENYPRLHESWNGAAATLKYRGSFVSLGQPQHVNGPWSAQKYSAPNRDWQFDTDFKDAANLPPLSPRFVYLRQQLFSRSYDQ